MERMSFPNESAEYRAARDKLLDVEMELRRRLQAVAAQRRALPPGGGVKEDYVFERLDANLRPEKVRLFDLFGEHPSILLYSYMYGPERDTPCTGCTHALDGMDGGAWHARQRFPIYVVAKSPIARLSAIAKERGWTGVVMLPTAANSYDADHFGDTSMHTAAMRKERGYEDGKSWDEPMYDVFTKDGDIVRHFWGSEILYAPEEPGQHHRAGDLVEPVWGLLDISPEGRGDFVPKLAYG